MTRWARFCRRRFGCCGFDLMRQVLVKTSVILFTLIVGAAAESVHTLILKGRVDEARDSLSQLASASIRDGNTLFYRSLLETDGARSVRLMEAALEASVHGRYREEIVYRLAQYYFLEKDYPRLSRLLAEYRSRWEQGKYQPAIARLSVLVDELNREYESSVRQCDRYLVDHSSGEAQQWGLVDKARVMEQHGKRIAANEVLRRLSRSKEGVGIPLSLYLLGRDAIAQDHADDAIFYYNILREGYPVAVGLDELLVGLGDMSDRSSVDNRAEEVTGTYYSVKVGVFSQSSNARRQADKFKGYDHKVETKTRKISGRQYRVVYVGRFQNYQEAVRFKLQLEATHNEAFQVVAR